MSHQVVMSAEQGEKPEGKVKLRSVLDLPISQGKTQVSLSSFAYLFSELVQYSQTRVNSTQELETRLMNAGYGIGLKMLELVSYREKFGKKEKNVKSMLQFVHTHIWKVLFGKSGDGLEISTSKENEYYIYDKEPLTNKFVSLPKEMGQFNCAAFIAGIINGVLDGAEFRCNVKALWSTGQTRTVYVIKLGEEPDPGVVG